MYNLQLTIKQKIILGFSTIGILLIAGSSFFYYSLNSISIANRNVETIAVPVQKQSNALQIKLLNMMKINALGFTQNDTSSLNNSHQRFTQFNSEYLSAVSTLKSKLAQQPKMLNALKQTQKHYQIFLEQSNALFNAKIKMVNANKSFSKQFNQFKSRRNKASDNMLDLETIEAPEKLDLLDVVIGSGTRIDDLLFTLKNTMAGLNQVDNLLTITQHKEDVGFLLNNIQDNFNYLKQQAEPLNDSSLLDEFTTNLTALSSLLNNPGQLYELQTQSISSNSKSQRAYLAAEHNFDNTYKQLSLLVNLADEKFLSLQNTAK